MDGGGQNKQREWGRNKRIGHSAKVPETAPAFRNAGLSSFRRAGAPPPDDFGAFPAFLCSGVGRRTNKQMYICVFGQAFFTTERRAAAAGTPGLAM